MTKKCALTKTGRKLRDLKVALNAPESFFFQYCSNQYTDTKLQPCSRPWLQWQIEKKSDRVLVLSKNIISVRGIKWFKRCNLVKTLCTLSGTY